MQTQANTQAKGGTMPRISEKIAYYQHPRTVAEMIPVRQAELEAHAHEVHLCPQNSGHGPLAPRDLKAQTYEQMWCGIWYDCQAFNGTHRCMGGTFYPSRHLAYEHGEHYSTGHGFEKFTPAGWVAISDEEADAFWSARVKWTAQRQAAALKASRRRGSRKAAQS